MPSIVLRLNRATPETCENRHMQSKIMIASGEAEEQPVMVVARKNAIAKRSIDDVSA
jgi:hypothetical protein